MKRLEIDFFNKEDGNGGSSVEVLSVDKKFHMTGSMKPKNTGRCIEFEFEPDWFSDLESEIFFDKNWEEIEKKIKAEYDKI